MSTATKIEWTRSCGPVETPDGEGDASGGGRGRRGEADADALCQAVVALSGDLVVPERGERHFGDEQAGGVAGIREPGVLCHEGREGVHHCGTGAQEVVEPGEKAGVLFDGAVGQPCLPGGVRDGLDREERVALADAGQDVAEADRGSGGDAGGQAQDALFPAAARELAGVEGGDRCVPVDGGCRDAVAAGDGGGEPCPNV